MPLTKRGKELLKAFQKRYGKKKGTQVFYATANKNKWQIEIPSYTKAHPKSKRGSIKWKY